MTELGFKPFTREEMKIKLRDEPDLLELGEMQMDDYERYLQILSIVKEDTQEYPLIHRFIFLQTKRHRGELSSIEKTELDSLYDSFKSSLKTISALSEEAHAHYQALFSDEAA